MGTRFRHLVETPEEPFEVIGNQFAVSARQVVHTFINRAEGARPALFVEIAAEALVSACRADADEVRQFLLFLLQRSVSWRSVRWRRGLESCCHRASPSRAPWRSSRAQVSATDDPLFLEPVEGPIVAHGFAARAHLGTTLCPPEPRLATTHGTSVRSIPLNRDLCPSGSRERSSAAVLQYSRRTSCAVQSAVRMGPRSSETGHERLTQLSESARSGVRRVRARTGRPIE